MNVATISPAVIQRKLFDVDSYYAMADAGILTQEDRVELIHGEIIRMAAIGSRHSGFVNRINKRISNLIKEEIIISVQNPVRLSRYSEPEPDIAVLEFRADFYEDNHPTPDDVLFLIEVADTSIGYDYDVKLPMYAAANIPEVWVVDINQSKVTQHFQPDGNKYLEEKMFGLKETIHCQQLDFELTVQAIFA